MTSQYKLPSSGVHLHTTNNSTQFGTNPYRMPNTYRQGLPASDYLIDQGKVNGVINLLQNWQNSGHIEKASISARSNPKEPAVFSMSGTLQGLIKGLDEFRMTSYQVEQRLKALEEEVEDQIPEIEGSVSAEFIKGVRALAKALTTNTTLDMLINDEEEENE